MSGRLLKGQGCRHYRRSVAIKGEGKWGMSWRVLGIWGEEEVAKVLFSSELHTEFSEFF